MHLRYRSVLLLVSICIAFAIPAFAAKPAPTNLASQPIPHAAVGPQVVLPCLLPAWPPSNTAFGYILPPNDAYFTLFNSSDCVDCAGGPVKATFAHVEHFYPLGDLPCDIPVTVSIVRAVDPGDGCLAPNPFDIICGPVQYIISYPGIDDACVDFSMALPAGCCINGPAFLEIEYNQGTCPSGRPAFCGQNPCTSGPCHQYNIYPGGNDDLCLVINRNVAMYVEATCCVVPTIPQSWGQMKTLYR